MMMRLWFHMYRSLLFDPYLSLFVRPYLIRISLCVLCSLFYMPEVAHDWINKSILFYSILSCFAASELCFVIVALPECIHFCF